MKKIIIITMMLLLSACSLPAPKYQPSTSNSNILQDVTGKKISIGQFKESKAEVNNLSLRGGRLISPYNESYSQYLAAALEEELRLAGILDNASDIQISGMLMDNQLDISGFSVGTASITAKFSVIRKNKMLYEKTLTARHEWESSFIGGIAIPAGQNNYPVVVQKLFTALFNDKKFQAAVK